jgi:hypothetical protein
VTIIDLYAEMCLKFNGRPDKDGDRVFPSLLVALDHYGLDSISAAKKDEMRDLILRGNYTPEEKQEILAYCWTDVVALEKLFPAMLPSMNVYQAMQRGTYTRVVAAAEFNGVPIVWAKQIHCRAGRCKSLRSRSRQIPERQKGACILEPGCILTCPPDPPAAVRLTGTLQNRNSGAL